MLYLTTTDGRKVIVLESANLDELKKGRPAHTPDASVVIAWTPDPVWLADKIMEAVSEGNDDQIGRLIDEAAKRPQKGPRPHHAPHQFRAGQIRP